MNYVEQLYSTNIKLRAFEDALAETMVLIQVFVTENYSRLRIYRVTRNYHECVNEAFDHIRKRNFAILAIYVT